MRRYKQNTAAGDHAVQRSIPAAADEKFHILTVFLGNLRRIPRFLGHIDRGQIACSTENPENIGQLVLDGFLPGTGIKNK